MNLFVTSTDPCEAALNLDDKRVVKMILETTQMLCCALHGRGIAAPYKPTHARHPVTLWIAREPAHGAWAHRHGLALCGAYTGAFGRIHASQAVLEDIAHHFKCDDEPQYWQNSARNGVWDFSHYKSVPHAYRRYLLCRWHGDKRPVTWTGRPVPRWARRYGYGD